MNANNQQKTALVTGGSKGIGFAIARALASEGYALKLVARDLKSLEQARENLTKEFNNLVDIYPLNLSIEQDIEKLIPAFSDVNVLVNSAGAIGRGSILDIDPKNFKEAWDGKVMSTILLSRAACAQMYKKQSGAIINIIGTAGERLNAKSIGTTAANAALIAFTKALGSESVDHKVRVIGINPGLTRTGRTQNLLNPKTEIDRNAYDAMLKNLPFGRMGEANEIADLALFLISDKAQYISGEVISVDAGARFRY
jgi:NAD(P)-dependent dehydrogenase (short-subunit alcohol dehydrogenase family)